MSNHRLNVFILLVVILVLAGATSNKHIRVEGTAACSEGLGACGAGKPDCQASCAAKHPGVKTQGSCDPSTTPPLCTCYFDCPPPPGPPAPKTCSGAAGLCSAKCENQCCNDNCAGKYSEGRGFCNMLGSTWLCQCQYSC